MNKEPLINFIKQNIPNIWVDEEGLLTIAEQFEEKLFKKGAYLLKTGKMSEYFFLSNGFLRAFTFDTNHEEVTTYFYSEGRVVFDASSFFLRIPSTENIQAVTDCGVYVTNFEKLNMLFHSVPEFREFGRMMLVKEFVAYKQRTVAMINKSAEQRYEDLLKDSKEIFQFAPLKQIASYLGVSERTLNRIRRDFAKK